MKWLSDWPISDLYSFYVPDTFQFSNLIRGSELYSTDKVMVSFDIGILFMNIALQNTLRICTNALYKRSPLDSPSIPENLFLEFMYLATEGVEFSFNVIIYVQIDRVLMGSPSGPCFS